MGYSMAVPAVGEDADSVVELLQRLAAARGLDEVMQVVRSGARCLTGADGVTFVLRDGDQCFYADEDAISPLWKGQRFPLETCISGWAMLNRRAAIIEDIYEDPRIPLAAYRVTFVRSLVMVPVRAEDPVAAIGAYWATRRRPSDDEVRLLETIANGAAVALLNAQLNLALEQAAEDARRRAAEAERQAAELARALAEVERLNQQKSRFLAACSHDLRQPFQAMRLFQLVLAGRVGETERPVVDRLGEAMSHGEDLLHALLDVSTLETGLVQPQAEAVPMAAVLDRVHGAFADQAAAEGVRLKIAPCGAVVRTDPLILHRILGNLVANAVKYAPRGTILVGCRHRGSGVGIEVRDNGPGIPAGQIHDIFEDFYQIGNPERDKRQGLGLGLGIVRRLCRLLGHTIEVRSRPGHGSVFTVTVPMA